VYTYALGKLTGSTCHTSRTKKVVVLLFAFKSIFIGLTTQESVDGIVLCIQTKSLNPAYVYFSIQK
jgi:hypothetical protein